jgi:hypothetical protein
MVDFLISAIYALGMVFGSSYASPISGILHRNVVFMKGLEYGDVGYSSYSGLSLIITSCSSFPLVLLLHIFNSRSISIGTHGVVTLAPRLNFVLLVGSCCKFGNWGFLYRKVATIVDPYYSDGSYCSLTRKLFLSYKICLFSYSILLLCLLTPGIDSIGSHTEEKIRS